jgi:hypothetical protein
MRTIFVNLYRPQVGTVLIGYVFATPENAEADVHACARPTLFAAIGAEYVSKEQHEIVRGQRDAALQEVQMYRSNAEGIAKAVEDGAMKLEAARVLILELEAALDEANRQDPRA